MQRAQRRADDAVADTRQPAGAPGGLLVHVDAQHLDEQHLGQLGQHPLATGPRRPRLGQRIVQRGLEPHAGVGAAHADLHHRRQPGQQQLRQARVAGQVAAHQLGGGATAPVSQQPRPACQHLVQPRARSRRQPGLRAHAVRVALREQHRVAGRQPQRRQVAEFDPALAFGDQVEDHHALGRGLEERRRRIGMRRLVAPGRGEAPVQEDRADQAHDPQRLRQRVHQSATSDSTFITPPRRCAAPPPAAARSRW